MELKDFPKVQIDSTGQFHLVPKDILMELLALKKKSQKQPTGTGYLVIREEVGALVQKFRKINGWTQEQLVQQDGDLCSLRTVTNLEGGKQKRKPHFSTFEILIRIFGNEFERELGKIMPTNKKDYSIF